MSDCEFQANLFEATTGCSLGETYRTRFSANTFLSFIALDAFQKLEAKLSKVKFFSVSGDDSSDVVAIENSLWYIRYALNGVINVNFIGNVSLLKADAESILKGLENLLSSNLNMSLQNFSDKLVSATTDGASVMMGSFTGVGVRLQNMTPGKNMLIFHCMAHRLELAFKDVCLSCSLYTKGAHWLANSLFYFYGKKNSLNRANLREAGKCLGIKVQDINLRQTRGMILSIQHFNKDVNLLLL